MKILDYDHMGEQLVSLKKSWKNSILVNDHVGAQFACLKTQEGLGFRLWPHGTKTCLSKKIEESKFESRITWESKLSVLKKIKKF